VDDTSGEWASLSDAAARLGLPEKKLRKRIKRGTLAVRVRVSDTAVERASPDPTGPELVRLLARLQEENRTLAGQLGFLQAQLAHTREALTQAQETIRALEAPAPSPPTPSPPPAEPTPPPSAPAPRPSRWRFWRRG